MDRNHWIIHQEWKDLVFMHWPIPTVVLRSWIPEVFNIYEFDGTAWIAIVPFRMQNIHFKSLPPLPFGHQLLELNARTYVSYQNEPGVYFITLDANHPLGVFLARTLFGLPYVHAQIRFDQNDQSLQISSRRTNKGYTAAHFHANIYSFTSPMHTRPGSLLYWLTERYALWVVRGPNVYKEPIFHKHWELQKDKADIEFNQLVDFLPPYFSK